MEDKIVKDFLCACDCKVAIKEIIVKYGISLKDFEDYKDILIEIKEWIEYIIGDE